MWAKESEFRGLPTRKTCHIGRAASIRTCLRGRKLPVPQQARRFLESTIA